ncbi:MAG: hypothetical protein ACK41C_07320 [Phenylobacterium sp.]|jgi:hypothetical protein
MRLPVIPAVLRARAAYQTALETGRSVEAAELWDFVETFIYGRRELERAG